MTKTHHPAHHETFAIERTYPASPARVFAAWATSEAKRQWFGAPSEWTSEPHQMDFRVGGRETSIGGPPGGVVHRFDATYYDIVDDHRLVFAYDLYLGATRISVSLVTVEIVPAGRGATMLYTEQVVFLDGYDDAGSRKRGTEQLLDNLGAVFAS